MNCILIDSVPKGEFEEININQQFANKTDDYKERYSLFIDRVLSLIEQRKPIKYTCAGMPTLDKKIEDALAPKVVTKLGCLHSASTWPPFRRVLVPSR